MNISIHALREEGDVGAPPGCFHKHISIHALREEGDNFRPGTLKKYQAISIHALREEGDISQRLCFPVRLLFLSTPSARRATDDSQPDDETKGISIPALREEGDASIQPISPPLRYFYPRPPRGGRQRDVCKRYPDG